MRLEIQLLTWDMHKYVEGFNRYSYYHKYNINNVICQICIYN
jgi:hypothetical protein